MQGRGDVFVVDVDWCWAVNGDGLVVGGVVGRAGGHTEEVLVSHSGAR